MAHPSESEVARLAREDSGEAIELARRRDRAYPVATIADGGDRAAQATAFHQRWWRQLDEDWPEPLRETYNEAFTQELMAARVAVVELHFETARGNWINIGVVDLEQWEPTFPFDPASSGWVRQDPRSRVGWRRRSALRKLFGRKQKADKELTA
ncbi:MAG TPA: hypothetical protein VEB65_00880 [Solirubrobacterales bacterium]|nr:hypothetical protein [Solirubrobacterales bacterium]